MKRIHSCALAAAAALVCGAASASWTCNPSDGTLTDGVWTLNATLVKNTTDQLDVSGQKGSFEGTEIGSLSWNPITMSCGRRISTIATGLRWRVQASGLVTIW